MSDRPLDPHEPDDLSGIEDLSPDDPRVTARGPRARSQLRAYRDFVAPGDVPDGARVGEAEDRLRQMLEREIAGVAGAAGERHAAESPARGDFWTRLLGPRLRPAFALAALVIVVSGVWLVRSSRRTEPPVMRGSEAPPAASDLASATVTRSDGSVRLEWLATPGATTYTLVFLSADLAEIARVPDVTTTNFDLRAGALPAGLTAGTPVLWRVQAMNGNDELARSKTTALTVP